jgi:crossover junction endodeoxyribonuclease RuvC
MPTNGEYGAGTRILGIDPGLNITGYAVVEVSPSGPVVCEAGVLRGTGRGIASRLRALHQGIADIIDQFAPRVMVVEQLYAHYAHPRTAILMAHARGVILLAAAQRGIEFLSYSATRIKKTMAGSGRASKDQIQRTIQRELRLPALPEPPDVADALAAALCHYYVHHEPIPEQRVNGGGRRAKRPDGSGEAARGPGKEV